MGVRDRRRDGGCAASWSRDVTDAFHAEVLACWEGVSMAAECAWGKGDRDGLCDAEASSAIK